MQAVLRFHVRAWLLHQPCRNERTHEGVLPTRLANAWRSLSSEGDDAVAAFAVYVRKCLHPLVSELTAVVNIFVRAWLCISRAAIRHADRFANAWRSLTVTAFAVYVRKCLHPLVSELTAVVNIFVRAWLIASRIVYMYIFNRFFAVKN